MRGRSQAKGRTKGYLEGDGLRTVSEAQTRGPMPDAGEGETESRGGDISLGYYMKWEKQT